jgi:hypothetical protein
MKVYVAVEMMGGPRARLLQPARREGLRCREGRRHLLGHGLPAPATSVPKADEVWLVVCGDSGCLIGCLGAFVSQEAAKSEAVAAEAADPNGMSFWAVKKQVEV